MRDWRRVHDTIELVAREFSLQLVPRALQAAVFDRNGSQFGLVVREIEIEDGNGLELGIVHLRLPGGKADARDHCTGKRKKSGSSRHLQSQLSMLALASSHARASAIVERVYAPPRGVLRQRKMIA